MTHIPEGWTDDMSIVLPSGVTPDKVVDVVLRSEANREAYETIVAELVKMGLTEDDARLAHDRALGGLVRAATRNPMNAPLQDKDPIAWTSYQRSDFGDTKVVAALETAIARLTLERGHQPPIATRVVRVHPVGPWSRFQRTHVLVHNTNDSPRQRSTEEILGAPNGTLVFRSPRRPRRLPACPEWPQ
jgi:hypothetical protein